MKNQQGFTLIELVVVIVILGILAAVAVPKFIDLQVDARKASINGMYGATQSAASLARAQALVNDATGATGTIQMAGDDVDMVFGYPAMAAGGIDEAVNTNGFNFVAGTGTTPAYFYLGSGTPADCRVSYLQAADATTPPVIDIDDDCL